MIERPRRAVPSSAARLPAGLGVAEAFRPGDRERAEQVMAALDAVGIRHLRLCIAVRAVDDWHRWLLPRLAEQCDLLLGFDDPVAVANFAETLGTCFDWVEADSVEAAREAKRLHRKVVLTGCRADRLPPLDGLDALAAVSREALAGLRDALPEPRPELWIVTDGGSSFGHHETAQAEAFLDAAAAPAQRIYWGTWRDLDPELPSAEGFHVDERAYHRGMVRADGTPKLLWRGLAKGGVPALRAMVALRSAPTARRLDRPVVITGGAGFLGTNLADRLLREGRPVLIYDNLSRPGVEENLAWLQAEHPGRVAVELGDVRDPWLLRDAVAQAGTVFHLAAQVAVTTSLADPATDFEINLRGTFNLLDALRRLKEPPPLVFASTNKVYGDLGGMPMVIDGERWAPRQAELRDHGVPEAQPLDLHSPYGCSKGGADQYVLDHARLYGLPATVFRMSCLYGPHQHGTEDQGWVAHFLISALAGRPITVYGDGRQVRDLLYVDDVVEAYLRAASHIERLRGRAFNIGGGPRNALSLRDLLALIEHMNGVRPSIEHGPWRPGDQLYYVSDTRRFAQATGWAPQTRAEDGIARLNAWLKEQGRAQAWTAAVEASAA